MIRHSRSLLLALTLFVSPSAFAQVTAEDPADDAVLPAAERAAAHRIEENARPGAVRASVPFGGSTLDIRSIGDEQAVFLGERELARDLSARFGKRLRLGGSDVVMVEMGAGSGAICDGFLLVVWQDDQGRLFAKTPPYICGIVPHSVRGDDLYFFSDVLDPGQNQPVVRWKADRGFELAGNLAFAPSPGTGWEQLNASGRTARDLFSNAAVYAEAQRTASDQLYGLVKALSSGPEPQSPEPGVFVLEGCSPNQCDTIQALCIVDAVHRRVMFAARTGGALARIWPEDRTQWTGRAAEALERFEGGAMAIEPITDPAATSGGGDDSAAFPSDMAGQGSEAAPTSDEPSVQ